MKTKPDFCLLTSHLLLQHQPDHRSGVFNSCRAFSHHCMVLQLDKISTDWLKGNIWPWGTTDPLWNKLSPPKQSEESVSRSEPAGIRHEGKKSFWNKRGVGERGDSGILSSRSDNNGSENSSPDGEINANISQFFLVCHKRVGIISWRKSHVLSQLPPITYLWAFSITNKTPKNKQKNPPKGWIYFHNNFITCVIMVYFLKFSAL